MGKLREELKQGKPFRNLREEAILNVWRTGDLVANRLHQLLKTHGISQTQYNVLRILRGAGSDGLPCGEIAGRMLTRDPDTTRLMDRLVRRGFAHRTRLRQDRRSFSRAHMKDSPVGNADGAIGTTPRRKRRKWMIPAAGGAPAQECRCQAVHASGCKHRMPIPSRTPGPAQAGQSSLPQSW
jgi:hypothetical protein